MGVNINYDSFGGWSISKEMFNWINDNFPENSVILELGSGNGSIELVKKYKVYSVEHDEIWLNKSDEVNYIFAPLVDNWYDTKILKKNLPKKYDLLIIDGPPGWLRENIINHLYLFDKHVTIIVDDTNREIDSNMSKTIAEKFKKNIFEISSDDKKFSIIK
jgi:cellulose biosynthesis protein BcsQ